MTRKDYYPHIISESWDEEEENTRLVSLTLGAIGCAKSHKTIWEWTVQNKYERVLILEDDIEFLPEYNNLQEMFSQVPEDWDIVYLGSSQYKIKKKINNYVSKLNYAFCTLGYIIHHRSAEKLLKMFPIKYQLDTSLNWGKNSRFDPESLNKYILEPNVIKNCFMKSDIQAN